MRDWAAAIVLGVIVAGILLALGFLMTLLSVLLVPLLFFVGIVLVIWFILQICREERQARRGKGPGP